MLPKAFCSKWVQMDLSPHHLSVSSTSFYYSHQTHQIRNPHKVWCSGQWHSVSVLLVFDRPSIDPPSTPTAALLTALASILLKGNLWVMLDKLKAQKSDNPCGMRHRDILGQPGANPPPDSLTTSLCVSLMVKATDMYQVMLAQIPFRNKQFANEQKNSPQRVLLCSLTSGTLRCVALLPRGQILHAQAEIGIAKLPGVFGE